MERKNREICEQNPNYEFFKEIIQEDLPLFKMLATNGRKKPS